MVGFVNHEIGAVYRVNCSVSNERAMNTEIKSFRGQAIVGDKFPNKKLWGIFKNSFFRRPLFL